MLSVWIIYFSLRLHNFIYEKTEYQELPTSVIKSWMFEAVNEWLEDFSTNPEQYISDRLSQRMERELKEYQAA